MVEPKARDIRKPHSRQRQNQQANTNSSTVTVRSGITGALFLLGGPYAGVTTFDDAPLVEHRRPLDQACDDLPIELRHRITAAHAHRERATGVTTDVLPGELAVA